MDIEIDRNPAPTPEPRPAPLSEPELPIARPILFKGNATEFFSIWIVNTLLSIVTLGIYSAWAKVRTQRYFLGNTELEGSRFEYTGDPVRILKGRLLVAVFLGVHFLVAKVAPQATIVTGLALMIATPWAIVNALSFRLTNTMYRGIRFGFAHDYKGAYSVYILHSLLLSLITVGLYLPAAIAKWHQFLARNTRYGKTPMTTSLSTADVYDIAARIVGPAILIAILFAALGSSLKNILFGFATLENKVVVAAIILAAVMAIYLGLGLMFSLLYIKTRRAFWNKSAFGSVRLASHLSAARLIWIQITNGLAIVGSLGLLYPWAKVRTYRYVVSQMNVIATSQDIELFAQDEIGNTRAVGDASVDLFGIGLDF